MNTMDRKKIKNFTDLLVWQRGHQLVIKIYKLTEDFPKEEKFGLTDQIRRASISITSNIAEGFGRSGINDKAHFFTMAIGSLYEVQNQLLVSRDVGYLNPEDCVILFNESIEISKMCSALISKVKDFSRN